MRRPRSSAFALLAACHAAPRPVAHACPQDRPIILAGQDDIAAFAGCTSAASITIRTGMALDFAPLRSLTTIRGDLAIGPSVGLEEITLANLGTVGGTVKLASNNLMQGMFLPKLTHAHAVIVDGNVALQTLSLPRLATVDGDFTVTDGSDLELIEASSLTTIGGTLTIRGTPELALAEFGALAHVAAVVIEHAGKLPTDAADRLRALAAPAPEKPQ